jgi:hypothetical protein
MTAALIIWTLGVLSFGYTLGALSAPSATVLGASMTVLFAWLGGGLWLFS